MVSTCTARAMVGQRRLASAAVVSPDARVARGVLDGDDAPPLLHGEGLRGVEAETFGLHLRVEGVKVEVYHHAVVRGGDARGRGRADSRAVSRPRAGDRGSGDDDIGHLPFEGRRARVEARRDVLERATRPRTKPRTSRVYRVAASPAQASSSPVPNATAHIKLASTTPTSDRARTGASSSRPSSESTRVRLFARGIDVSETASAHETRAEVCGGAASREPRRQKPRGGRRFERDVRNLTRRERWPHRVPIPNPNGAVNGPKTVLGRHPTRFRGPRAPNFVWDAVCDQ